MDDIYDNDIGTDKLLYRTDGKLSEKPLFLEGRGHVFKNRVLQRKIFNSGCELFL
jgi:hypothetical protein